MFFGEYLVEKGIIKESDALEALHEQQEATPRFEKAVIEMGLMDMSEVFKVLTLSAETDLEFPEIAVKHGFLDQSECDLVTTCINSEKPPVGEVLVKLGKIDIPTMEKELASFQESVQAFDEIKLHLEQIDMFKDIESVALRALSNSTRLIEFEADKTVIQEGEPSRNVYAVVQGSLMITKAPPEPGKEPIYVGKIQAGEVFGESAILEEGTRNASVITVSKTALLLINHDGFLNFLSNFPAKSQPMMMFMVTNLMHKLNETNSELAELRQRLYSTPQTLL
jgi:CRP-like cAMP-binding protein